MSLSALTRHFVTFLSPGTLVAESTIQLIQSWDVECARTMAKSIQERHNAVPYGFYFTTMERGPEDWEPRETARSPMYYLPHCKVETLEEIEARNLPDERILRANMRGNGFKRVVVTTKGWKFTQPLEDTDVVLE
jgi:hypothetical protein